MIPDGAAASTLAHDALAFWTAARWLRRGGAASVEEAVRAFETGVRVQRSLARDAASERLRRLAAREIGRLGANPLLVPPGAA